MDVHEYLYDEESALFGVHYTDVYDNSIRWTDGMMEVLLSSFADLGYLDNTLVVVTSDHGEAFGERGLEGHGVSSEATPWSVTDVCRTDRRHSGPSNLAIAAKTSSPTDALPSNDNAVSDGRS